MSKLFKQYFLQAIPKVDFCSFRLVHKQKEILSVRQNKLQPLHFSEDLGAMLCVIDQGGIGYAATSILTPHGIAQALTQATEWAHLWQQHGVCNFSDIPFPKPIQGKYQTPIQQPWDSLSVADKVQLLMAESLAASNDNRIVDWGSDLSNEITEQWYITSQGTEISQQFNQLTANTHVTAHNQGETQQRSFRSGITHQGGLELLQNENFYGSGAQVADEALQLLAAEQCPAETMDVILMPDQMMLQIHESIGHPLELDRILGDERNYAGTSFVTLDMFGHYQYGSELLNVSFDPSIPTELASYAFDDEGLPAEKQLLIANGILQRPLGGYVSQHRAQINGVANARAQNWNRPPIDRMANLNVEPGNSSLKQLINQVERGILLATNRSWSIDDSRNKFQFGCEWGQLIQNGQLTKVVKNSNYRGISANFWRNLAGVGNQESWEIHGVSHCGKGEMNQAITVGHASPPGWFRDVDVF